MQGHVYILMNPAFPNLVKIGRTTKTPKERASELSTTGSPDKFIVVHSVLTSDCVFLEQALHEYFKDSRYNENREFFKVTVASVIRKIDELVGAQNFRLDSKELTNDGNVIEVLLYSVIFGADYKVARIGVIPAGKQYEIIGNGFTLLCSAEEYLSSSDFKSELNKLYEKNSKNRDLKDYGISPEGVRARGIRVSSEFKVSESKRFKVKKNFYDSTLALISKELFTLNQVLPRALVLPDKQTIYHPNCSWDKFPLQIAVNNLIQLFQQEEQGMEFELNRTKTNNARMQFVKLLDGASTDIVSYWEAYLKSQGFEDGCRGTPNEIWDDGICTSVIDFSSIWEKYTEMLLADIESASANKELSGKI